MTFKQAPTSSKHGGGRYVPPHFLNPKSGKGRKRRFFLSGITNVFITNLVLQSLLITQATSIGMATMISQVCNGCFGYILYGRLVFNFSGGNDIKKISRYYIWLAGAWLINWLGIALLVEKGVKESLGGIIMIAPLACASYIIQKNWIFTDGNT
ncbi:GtrA family protein [Synechococcus sp. MIT S9508]|uniref:GtrA family protein n=1 Tax=Synechococcus sp. MIT S9508 TaxID=1801629 RepID=UPI0009EEF293|nr:GtrA family protein [Synechococcus sp. MIT S9508]